MSPHSKAKDSQADSGRKPSRPDRAVQTYKTILVCYDGSDNALRALQKGIVVAKESGGELTVIVAADTRSFAARNLGRYFRDMRKYIIDYCEEQLSKAVETAENGGVSSVRGSVEEGHPVDMILAKAFDVDAELIVVGRRGLRGIQRHLLGSVSSSVVGQSTCDVLVVK
ncbi:MAG TPA: universal stress protein [Nitrososphaerales archaeon]|nr:universal stress protein [Nitrososphaerales archaeon]